MPLSKIQGIEGQVTPNLGRRNIIINGDMTVAQRGTSSTGTGYQTVDRFAVNQSNYDELSATKTQETDSPDGFSKSFKVLVSTEETAVASDEYANISYAIEGQDLQRLAYGTSSAKSFTLSFYVKSNVTGNFSVTAYTQTGSNRQQDRRYTINTANTWEHKSLTFVGDTAQSIVDSTSVGMYLYWHLGFGSSFGTVTYNASAGWSAYADSGWGAGHDVELLTTQNNYIQITGVQMEVGSESTSFEHRSAGEELALCQRYCWKVSGSTGANQVGGDFGSGGSFYSSPTGYLRAVIHYPTEMRAAPALIATGTFSHHVMGVSASNFAASGLALTHPNKLTTEILCTGTGYTSTTGLAGYLMPHYSGDHDVSTLLFHAEL